MPHPSLADVLRQQFPTATIPADETLLRIGAFPEWDSMAHFNLLLLVEETYGIRFSVDEMSELKSLNDIARVLAAHEITTP